jgi:hypothetical protein
MAASPAVDMCTAVRISCIISHKLVLQPHHVVFLLLLPPITLAGSCRISTDHALLQTQQQQQDLPAALLQQQQVAW